MNGGNTPSSFPMSFPRTVNSGDTIYNLHFINPGSYQISLPRNGVTAPPPSTQSTPGFHTPTANGGVPAAAASIPTQNGFTHVRAPIPVPGRIPRVANFSIIKVDDDDDGETSGYFSNQSQGSQQSQRSQQSPQQRRAINENN